MKLTTFLASLLGVTLVFAVVMMPVFACGCKKAGHAACLSNLKQMGLGTILYAGDHDERFPPRDVWMDEIAPYVKEKRAFHEIKAPRDIYGYAFDSRRAGRKPPPDAARAPLVYDSANPIRNASDPFASLPRPGRHGGKNGIAYADGHAKWVAASAPASVSGGGAP